MESTLSKAELVETIDEMQVVHEDEVAELQAEHKAEVARLQAEHKVELGGKQAKLDTACKGKSKAQLAAQVDRAKVKGAAKRARDEVRALMPGIREVARQQADEGLASKAMRKQELATAAHSEKRYWKERCENAEHLAACRQTELNTHLCIGSISRGLLIRCGCLFGLTVCSQRACMQYTNVYWQSSEWKQSQVARHANRVSYRAGRSKAPKRRSDDKGMIPTRAPTGGQP